MLHAEFVCFVLLLTVTQPQHYTRIVFSIFCAIDWLYGIRHPPRYRHLLTTHGQLPQNKKTYPHKCLSEMTEIFTKNIKYLYGKYLQLVYILDIFNNFIWHFYLLLQICTSLTKSAITVFLHWRSSWGWPYWHPNI